MAPPFFNFCLVKYVTVVVKPPIKVKMTGPDPVYNSTIYGKFVGHLILHGKKQMIESMLEKLLWRLNRRCTGGLPSILLFFEAIERGRPAVMVTMRRKGRRLYIVPKFLRHEEKEYNTSVSWLSSSIRRKRKAGPLPQLFERELLAATTPHGSAAQRRRVEVEELAVKNRMYMHYRWWV